MVAPLENVTDCRKLAVRAALRRLIELSRRNPDVDPELTAVLTDFEDHGSGVDTVSAFEMIVNRCLDSGYRGEGLLAFVFLALNRRFASRIKKRLKASPLGARTVDVEDLVMVAMEGVQKLFYRSDRERHSVTYSLLLSIADHRAIDHLRRKKANLVPCVDTLTSGSREPVQTSLRPDQQYQAKERETLLRLIRGAILESVNSLTAQQRRALILVEVEGVGYREVARRLHMK
ncbi:MAG: sigma-70 family RNA polymerase sigma factor, partial [Bradymonadia bacterium]